MIFGTKRRKVVFLRQILRGLRPLGFVDVGSGGPLKYPWSILSRDQVKKFDFDANPDAAGGGDACISNRAGEGTLHIARDPRSSSLHLPSEEFMQRFGHDDMRVVREIPVRLETVDRLFDGRANEIDLIDINAEGHDLMVLQGARDILAGGLVKLLKVEFELASAWEGQGYFGDIDEFMRGQGYVLADLQVDFSRPAIVENLAVRGEPIWGKSFYVPGSTRWEARRDSIGRAEFVRDVRCGIAANVLFDLPGRAISLAEMLEGDERPAILNAPRSGMDWIYRDAGLESVARSIGELSRNAFRSVVNR